MLFPTNRYYQNRVLYICDMTEMDQLKQALIEYCTQFVETQIKHVQTAIDSAKESAQNESKSSAGDKHETGKSLMQLEQENNAQHLSKMLGQKRIITLIQNHQNGGMIELGSLVETNVGYYYLALGIGKVEIESQTCFVISPTSPVGKVFQNKKADDKVTFNGKTIHILNVV